MIEGVEHAGIVIDIERSRRFKKGRLYLVKYQDGEEQHFTTRQLLALEAERRQALRRGKPSIGK